jgi:cytochrome c peroxidase
MRLKPRAAFASVLAVFAFLASASGQAVPSASGEPAKVERVLHLPDTPLRYTDEDLPAHFKTAAVRRLDNTPKDNPVTDAGATLGRILFYDTRFSANNTVACASCHQQKYAFSDPRRVSKGHAGADGDRNAMALVNVRYYQRGKFFWDERARTLEDQVLMPIQSKGEMGQDLAKLWEVLGKDARYSELYRKAFGDAAVTKERTAKALAQFVRSLVSYRSKFDEGLAKAGTIREEFPNFTGHENRGRSLFLQRCGVCHLSQGQSAVFFGPGPQNNGLDLNGKVADLGVADVTFNRFQAGLFKSPSLRNIEYTAPYMHDGRFNTLVQVIEHYSTGVKAHPNLDPFLRGPGGRIRMDNAEKGDLLAFLKTLSDPKFITDPKFSNPFEAKQGSAQK